MSENRFKIVFDGTLLPGVETMTAKLNLADLFKSDVESIEKLFSGRPVALKRDLSKADADTYLQALQKAGLDPRIESDDPVAFSLNETHDAGYAGNNDPARPAASPYAPPRAPVGDSYPQFSTLKVFGVEGRIGRLRYLAWTLVLSLVMMSVIGSVFTTMLTAFIGTTSNASTASFVLLGLLGMLLVIVFLAVNIQITAKRLHDLGWSGWLWFLHLVPVIGWFFPLLLILMPGHTGPNQYGAPPPPNSRSVKVLATLWIVLLIAIFFGAFAGGLATLKHEYDKSSYENSSTYIDEEADQTSIVVDEVEVQSADDAAQATSAPVDSAHE